MVTRSCEDYIPLAKFLAGKASRMSRARFDDIYSDALYGLARAGAKMYGSHLPFSYAKQAIEGAIVDGYRDRTKSRNKHQLTMISMDAGRVGSDGEYMPLEFEDPSALCSSEISDRLDIEEALDRLSARDQSILRLRYFLDLPQVQIGEILGITQGRVSQNLTDARARLREVYVAG